MTEEIKNENTEMVVNGTHKSSEEEKYVWPSDKRVLEKLEWFRDQKIGLMMHWGPYSQLGIVESWALSDEDADWSRHGIDWEVTGEELKRQYFDLNKTFNPIRFEPEKWADTAKDSGMKYLLFTTKHHDGFCMYDTKYTDYKITGADCPFRNNHYADICAHLFESFRKRDLGVIAYFSKADWHIDSYWSDKYERGCYQNRGPSYDPKENPEEWERFVNYTQNQIMELGTRYGRIDGMWFDAGWVCPRNGQDIRLGEVIERVRKFQPGMLCADRTVGGPYENYITPEQCVPENPMNIPWESCITLGHSFSFAYDDDYKTPREVICLLIDIVVKGGNLAINVGPQPDGRLPQKAVKSLLGVGSWLKVYGDAIYGTRVCPPYKKDGIGFTRSKDGGTVYAIESFEDEHAEVKNEVFIPYEGETSKVTALDSGEELAFRKADGGIIVTAPANNSDVAPIARVFCLR